MRYEKFAGAKPLTVGGENAGGRQPRVKGREIKGETKAPSAKGNFSIFDYASQGR